MVGSELVVEGTADALAALTTPTTLNTNTKIRFEIFIVTGAERRGCKEKDLKFFVVIPFFLRVYSSFSLHAGWSPVRPSSDLVLQ